jgi:signal transduction histidine kinase/ligand-binding sensor domain-containing protein
MRKAGHCNIGLLVFLQLVAILGQAQKTYRFESITVDDGLSQSGITRMAQDVSGYLWIGTQDGLNKYDGYSIKIYRNKEGDSTSLVKNYVTSLLVDKQGSVWVATLGHLSRYNPSTDGFTNYPLMVDGTSISPNVYVWDIFQSRDGRLVLSTSNGLLHFDPSTGLFHIEEEFRSTFGKIVFAYYETRTKGDWFFFLGLSMHRAPGSTVWKSSPLSGTRSYYDQKTDELYFYSDHREKSFLQKWDASGQWKNWIPLRSLEALEVCFTSKGSIWVATDDGVSIYDAAGKWLGGVTSYEISTTGVNEARALFESRDGVIWLGTNGYGLKKYNPQTNQFSYIGSSTVSSLHIAHPYVDAIHTDNDTILYVSTPNGLDVLNLVKRTSQHFPQTKRIRRIFRDQGQLWLCGPEKLWLFKNNQFIDLEFESRTRIYPHPSMPLAYPGHGRIALLDQGNKTYLLKKKPETEDITVHQVIGDTLWVGTGPGTSHVEVFDLRTRQSILKFRHDPQNAQSFPSGGGIKCVYKDSRNRIWIGTAGGLIRCDLKENKFVLFTEKDGLPNNTIYGILEDDRQHLWISTNKGLCDFDPVTKKVRNFEAFDGLQSNEFNTGAAFKSKSGVMYFGGVNGVTYFKPAEIANATSIIQSAVSGFYVNNKLIKDYTDYISRDQEKDRSRLLLNYDERDFGFDVVGIGFSLPGRLRYRYMLENYDRDWHDIGNIRHISFTNIPPGDYVFKIQSSDSYGNWEARGASVAITIRAPLWWNPWLWIGGATLLVALILFAYYWRIGQLKSRAYLLERIVSERTQEIKSNREEIATRNEELLRQASYLEEKNRELERAKGLLEIEVKYLHQRQLLKASIDVQEEERKRIAQDLHDELGAVLSIARMHLVQMQEEGEGLDRKEALRQAQELTESALAAMRRFSHELMPPQLEKFGLVKTLQAIATQTNAARQIEMELLADDHLPRWSMPVELGLYRVCMEMINNTLKHAQARHIRIQLKQYADQILFSYADDGKGLPEQYTEGHGFKNIEARVNIMGGTIRMTNQETGGFFASLTIPMSESASS